MAAEAVRREKERRAELAAAIAAVIVFAKDEEIRPSTLRDHLRLYYGQETTMGATAAELCAGVAVAGGVICDSENNQRNRVFLHVKLRKPSATERRRVAAKWNKALPPAELPMIKRAFECPESRHESVAKNEIFDLVPGLVTKIGGVHRQIPDPESVTAWRDGGGGRGKGGTVARRRRFPDYIERLSKYLASGANVSAVDRQMIEFVIDGKSLQWIADELSMTKANVHKRIASVRRVAGIAGPGPGR